MPSGMQRAGEATTAGKILFLFSFAVALGALAWLIAGPLDGFSGWWINKAGAIFLIVAFGVGLVVLLFGAFLVYAALGALLEALGIEITHPAPAGAAPERGGAAGLAAPPPSLAPAAATHGLTAEEATRAQVVGAYCLYAYGTDSHGWPESYLQTVAVCLNDAELERERATRVLEPDWDGFKSTQAMTLLGLVESGQVTAAQAREFLRRIDAGEPHQAMVPPLAPEERARAAGIQVYYVQYEDNFGSGGQRDSFPVAVCLTEAEAAKVAASCGRPLQPGADGYQVEGPYSLALEHRPGVVREVLARVATGEGGAVTIDSASR